MLARLQSVRGLIRELLQQNLRDPGAPSMLPSVIKVAETSLRQRFYAWQTRLNGGKAQYFEPAPAQSGEMPGEPFLDYIDSFAGTIAGGTNEIQLNIISERGLGMPRG
jgi:hypothetical protein